jgi:hypothetical protein
MHAIIRSTSLKASAQQENLAGLLRSLTSD